MVESSSSTVDTLVGAATAWLAAFESALTAGNPDNVEALFVADGEWRDMVSLSWDVQSVFGASDIASTLVRQAKEVGARDFRVVLDRVPAREVTRGNRLVIEVMFGFRVDSGFGGGVLRLKAGDQTKAQTLLTTLDELDRFPDRVGAHRPKHAVEGGFGDENWLDMRKRVVRYDDRDPEVLVVGAGQAGLTVAARLAKLGVDTLVVDAMDRVGDNWRRRYDALTLHNETWVSHLPYMPFPDAWPTFLPKDMVALWFETYAEAMELNVWTSTEFVGADYDRDGQRWTAHVRRENGGMREVRPRHVIMATGGVSGIPNLPEIPGLGEFGGEVLHSSAYRDADRFNGKRVVVFGTGTSAHDVAQDLHGRGCQVTMVQRSSTTVLSLEPSGQMAFSLYWEGWDTEDADMIAMANTLPTLVRANQIMAQRMYKADKDLIESLHAIDFRTDNGEDETGFSLKYNRRGGGYYVDVGCSQLLAREEIALIQYADIATVNESGALMSDGSRIEADAIVLATGYKNQQEEVRRFFGDEVADVVGLIWSYDDDSELRNVYRRTRQDGLWFMAGSFVQARYYSKFLAQQIVAQDAGLSSAPERLSRHGTRRRRQTDDISQE